VDLPAVYAKVQHAASPVHIRKGVALCLLVFERDIHATLASVFIGFFCLTAQKRQSPGGRMKAMPESEASESTASTNPCIVAPGSIHPQKTNVLLAIYPVDNLTLIFNSRA
jgi:hypothetical protein